MSIFESEKRRREQTEKKQLSNRLHKTLLLSVKLKRTQRKDLIAPCLLVITLKTSVHRECNKHDEYYAQKIT